MGIIIYILINYFINEKYNEKLNKSFIFIFEFINIYIFYFKKFDLFIIFNSLLILSITDYINNDVYTIFNILIIFNSFIFNLFNLNNILASLLLIIILYILSLKKHSIGNGDIELIFALSFNYSLYEISLILLISSIINLIYSIFNKKPYYAFVPFICISIYLLEFLNII